MFRVWSFKGWGLGFRTFCKEDSNGKNNLNTKWKWGYTGFRELMPENPATTGVHSLMPQ